MRLKGRLVILGLAFVAIATIIEILLQDTGQEVWEKFKEKNKDKVGNIEDG